jgi:hypothetical protein
MQVTISDAGDLSDPRTRVRAIEAATRAICQQAGQDPADGTMMLLTAAAHLHSQYIKPGVDPMISLAQALGAATVAADDFFKLRNS